MTRVIVRSTADGGIEAESERLLLDVREVCEVLHVGKTHLYSDIIGKPDGLQPRKVGGRTRFFVADVIRYAQQHTSADAVGE